MRGRIISRDGCNYIDVSGVNMSTLLALRKSPKHYRHRLLSPVTQTPAMELGTTTHVAVLEPERFLRDYAMWQSVDPETGKTRQRRGKAWDAFCEDNDGKTIVRDAEYDQAVRIARAIRSDREAMRYLAFGEPEVTLEWTDARTGIGCKGRVDWITEIDGHPFIVDLKTARNVEPWAFSRDAAKLDYHVRMAFYADGYEAATGKAPGVAVVAVENTEPYDVVPYIVPTDVIDVGREVCGDLLDKLKSCLSDDKWPGIGGGTTHTLTLPAWAVPDEETDGDDIGLVGWKTSA